MIIIIHKSVAVELILLVLLVSVLPHVAGVVLLVSVLLLVSVMPRVGVSTCC